MDKETAAEVDSVKVGEEDSEGEGVSEVLPDSVTVMLALALGDVEEDAEGLVLSDAVIDVDSEAVAEIVEEALLVSVREALAVGVAEELLVSVGETVADSVTEKVGDVESVVLPEKLTLEVDVPEEVTVSELDGLKVTLELKLAEGCAETVPDCELESVVLEEALGEKVTVSLLLSVLVELKLAVIDSDALPDGVELRVTDPVAEAVTVTEGEGLGVASTRTSTFSMPSQEQHKPGSKSC